MRTPLAWLNLVHEKTRLLVAIAGVAFAVLLIFMNLGFLGALTKSATLAYSQIDADVFLVSPQTTDLSGTDPFPIERLYQADGISGVERIMPLYVGYLQWLNPETRISRAIFVYGINPDDPIFLLPGVQQPENRAALRQPNTVLMDRRSRPEYGVPTIGTITELDRRNVEIVGLFSLGGGFASDASLIMSDQNFRRFFDPRPLSQIDLGLIQLVEGTDAGQVAEKMRASLPEDVLVLTRQEMLKRETDYWIITTSTGFIFGMGVVVSFIVGTVIVYQVLYTDVASHMAQFATLKAMGYRSYYLFVLVLQEAIILSVLGYVPGFIISLGLYEMTFRATSGGLPIAMNGRRAIAVLLLTVIMCAISGVVSVQKAVRTDPAEVF